MAKIAEGRRAIVENERLRKQLEAANARIMALVEDLEAKSKPAGRRKS